METRGQERGRGVCVMMPDLLGAGAAESLEVRLADNHRGEVIFANVGRLEGGAERGARKSSGLDAYLALSGQAFLLTHGRETSTKADGNGGVPLEATDAGDAGPSTAISGPGSGAAQLIGLHAAVITSSWPFQPTPLTAGAR
jgi:hypothetical protein